MRSLLEAEIIDSEFDRYSDVGFRNSCIIEVELKILSSNENIIIGDVKPGDISTCISKKKYANLYQPGDFAIVYLSKNGKYYLSLGSYFEALTPTFFSLIWFVFLYSYIKRQKKLNNNS